ATKVRVLAKYGLDVRVLDGPIGAASALKMSYAGISKGHIAIFAAMVLAANRAGSAEALRKELAESEPALFTAMSQRVPRMFSKAWRWAPEMQEIAEFARDDAVAHDIWTRISALYDRLARDLNGAKTEIDILERFFNEP